jgi:hypothetical protein
MPHPGGLFGSRAQNLGCKTKAQPAGRAIYDDKPFLNSNTRIRLRSKKRVESMETRESKEQWLFPEFFALSFFVSLLEGCWVGVVLFLAPMGARSKAVR